MSDKHLIVEEDETLSEEIANAITHGLGVVLAVVGYFYLLELVEWQFWPTIAISSYGITLILTYFSSILYHGTQNPKLKAKFSTFDHCMIFLLIAGTYTPVAMFLLPDNFGWLLMGTVWILSVLGIVLRVGLSYRKFNKIKIAFYLVLGWVGVLWSEGIYEALGLEGGLLILVGGLCYCIGLIFFTCKWFKFHHAIWHLLVLLGSTFHFYAMVFYVLPAGGF